MLVEGLRVLRERLSRAGENMRHGPQETPVRALTRMTWPNQAFMFYFFLILQYGYNGNGYLVEDIDWKMSKTLRYEWSDPERVIKWLRRDIQTEI